MLWRLFVSELPKSSEAINMINCSFKGTINHACQNYQGQDFSGGLRYAVLNQVEVVTHSMIIDPNPENPFNSIALKPILF
jgi:hypothetical protein